MLGLLQVSLMVKTRVGPQFYEKLLVNLVDGTSRTVSIFSCRKRLTPVRILLKAFILFLPPGVNEFMRSLQTISLPRGG